MGDKFWKACLRDLVEQFWPQKPGSQDSGLSRHG